MKAGETNIQATSSSDQKRQNKKRNKTGETKHIISDDSYRESQIEMVQTSEKNGTGTIC